MTELNFHVLPNGRLPEGIKHSLGHIIPSLAGKKVRLSIGEAKEKRSLDQNAYYWSAIVPHVRKVRFDMGDPLTIEQVHEDLLAQFAPAANAKRIDGKGYSRPMRSKEMSVPEMADFLTAITACMAEFGDPVPMMEAE